jgi:hypothetical protein
MKLKSIYNFIAYSKIKNSNKKYRDQMFWDFVGADAKLEEKREKKEKKKWLLVANHCESWKTCCTTL